MQIKIKFYSTLKNVAGTGEISRNIESGKPLKEVLHEIDIEFFQPKDARLLTANLSDLETGTICLINDADISLSGGLNQKLKKECEITLISSLHGG